MEGVKGVFHRIGKDLKVSPDWVEKDNDVTEEGAMVRLQAEFEMDKFPQPEG